MLFGEAEKMQLALDVALDGIPLIRVQPVPLVHRQHQRAPCLQGKIGQMGILLGDLVARIDHQHHHIGILDRLQRLHHRELLHRLVDLAAAAHTGGVDDSVLLAGALEIDIDRIACGTGLVKSDDPLFAQNGVDKGGFSHVRTADDGKPRMVGFLLIAEFGGGQFVQRQLYHLGHIFAMGGGNGQRFAQTQLMEFCGHACPLHPFRLVHQQQKRAPALAQLHRDDAVVRGQAVAPIDDEQHQIGLVHRLPRLFRHFVQDAFLDHRLQTAGVNHQKGTFADAAATVMAVARQPRLVCHQRIATAREAVKQRGFTHVGTADENQSGQHHRLTASEIRRPSRVCTSAPSPSNTGAVGIALPSVARRAAMLPS